MFTPFKKFDETYKRIHDHEMTINLPLETISAELRQEKFRYFAIHIMNTAYETMPVPADLDFPFDPSEPANPEFDFEMCLLYRHTLRWLLMNNYVTASEMMSSVSDPFAYKNRLFVHKGAGSDILLTDKGLLAIERAISFGNNRLAKVASEAGTSFARDAAVSTLSNALASGGPGLIVELFSKLIGH